ncbi:MAG: alpha/beta fold hydrolase [Bradyrhizobium sp.]|nr:alpha/beta fold hydrolase [Bradyrhizobium sp.]
MQRRLAAILAADVSGYSRLMGTDEIGTLTALKAHRRELADRCIGEHRGRIVKTTGDGMLVEFASVVDAVACAVTIQRGMAKRNAKVPEERRIVFRIGINVGDIIIDGHDIFGDGVNIAARLETLCEPGGVCISRAANEQIRDKLSLSFADLGEQAVKNIARAVGVFGLGASDIVAIPETVDLSPTDESGTSPAGSFEQEIHYCQARDGVQLAYSRIGNGPPLVKTGNWLTHLEFDLDSPIWGRLYRDLASYRALIRYDARGNGLSDREVPDVSFAHFVDDLEAVVDAAGLDRFALFGISQGCAVSIAYAVRHPERVTHLILLGGYPQGWKKRSRTAAEKQAGEAMITLMRVGWGQENPAFRQMFTSQFAPDASKEQAEWFNELQRISTSPEDAVRNLLANGEVDVTQLLPQVKAPTLVMHARQDARVPFEMGRRLAAGIPGARFVPLESRNHIVLDNEPAFDRFMEEVKAFIAQ